MWLVPALRFPEFCGEWERCALAEICNIVGRIGFRGYTIQDIVDKGTGAIALSPSNITDNRLSYDKDNTYISYFKYEESPEIKVFVGDIVFVKTGSTVGKVAYVDNILCETTLNPQLVVLKKIKCNSFLLGQILSASKFQNAIKRITVGGAVPTLSQNEMGKISVSIPQKMEQKKIATLFQLIDERISVQNKIIDKLETLIKGIIETVISSQKPNTVIKDCLECNSSILQESQVAENGSFPVYGATGISGYTETADVNGESILIIKDGSGVGTVKFVTREYSYIGTLNRLIAKDSYCLKYIYFALQGFSFEPYKTGMAIPHIYFKDYGRAKIFCPTIEKQSAIAQKLSSIEDKVSVEKQILFYYQAQKSYLLSQMLI